MIVAEKARFEAPGAVSNADTTRFEAAGALAEADKVRFEAAGEPESTNLGFRAE